MPPILFISSSTIFISFGNICFVKHYLSSSPCAADKHFMFHPKGESFVKHTKPLTKGGLCPESTESSAHDWREAGEWFEVLLMKED